jgi:hypothetical protein
MSYYILQNDETKGPYTIGQLRAMWSSGAITGETLYCERGYDEWLPLSGIADQLESPLPPQTASYAAHNPTTFISHQHHTSVETRGRDSARTVKAVSGLCMVVGIVAGMVAATSDSSFVGTISVLLLIGGFFGFVLGRFME